MNKHKEKLEVLLAPLLKYNCSINILTNTAFQTRENLHGTSVCLECRNDTFVGKPFTARFKAFVATFDTNAAVLSTLAGLVQQMLAYFRANNIND